MHILSLVNRGGLYLAIYDLSENRERARVADFLEGFGIRVQKSAFELRLSKTHRARLLRGLDTLGIQSGWVALYRLDERAQHHYAGRAPVRSLAEEHHAYVI